MNRRPVKTMIVGVGMLLAMGSVPAARAPAQAPGSAPAAPPVNERVEQLPPELEGVGIDEHLDVQLPLDLEFRGHDGRPVKLGDFFDGKRPVILTLNYYRCPMLCTLQLNALVDALRDLEWSAGDQFRIVTISFDPVETPQLAALKRQSYLEQYGRPPAAGGWAFLTGRKKSVDTILETTGMHVKWSDEQQQWMHAAALIICTPDGRISRYLRNIVYEPKTVRLSLVEASEGKIGTTMDQVLLFCYHYDGGAGGYTFAAWNVGRLAGLVSLGFVGGLLLILWRHDRRARKAEPATA
ncbi:MAG: SCO family protein [Planctomycetota bacterium]